MPMSIIPCWLSASCMTFKRKLQQTPTLLVHAVTAVDSSGDTAKKVAESKKWLAVAALIPDQPPPYEPAATLPHPDHSPQTPSQTSAPLSPPVPVRQLGEPQLTPAPEPGPNPGIPSSKGIASDRTTSISDVPSSKTTASNRATSPSGIPSSQDMPPEQPPVCSRATHRTSQRPSSVPATQGPSPSCFTGVGQGRPIPQSLPHGPQQAQQAQQAQPPPVEQCADHQERVPDRQSLTCGRPAPTDAGASSIDEQALQPCPAKAEGKA